MAKPADRLAPMATDATSTDRRLYHASALAIASVIIDRRRNALRATPRSQLPWILAQRVLGCTAVVQTSSYLSNAALRIYHRRSDLAIVRTEWAAAIAAGLATTGIGTYGVEAGAQRYFGKSAASLSPIEAARMAAALPLPKERSVKNPRGWLARHGNTIAARIGAVRRDGLDSCI